MLAREMWEGNLTAFAECFQGLAMMSDELETIFAETLTEAGRNELQRGRSASDVFPDKEVDVVEKIEKLFDDLAGDDE